MNARLRAVIAVGTLCFCGTAAAVASPATAAEALGSWSEIAGDGDVYAATSRLPLVEIDHSAGTCECITDCDEGDYCDALDDWCQPVWTVSVGAVFLHRSRLDRAVIATPPTGTPGVLLNGSDFDFGTGAGPDVSIMRRTNRGLIWEARYFNDRSAEDTFGIPTVTSFRIAGIGVTILGGGPINARYQTLLDSSEVNVHKPFGDRVTFLAGFRWVELHDSVRVDLATPATFVNWDDNNHMYGGQVGTRIAFTDPGNPLSLTCALKGGVYYNDADNVFTSTIVGGATGEDQTTAFVGDFNFTAGYQLTSHISIQGGYQILWLDNVAIAADSAATTTQIPGGTSSPVDADGRLWYHGATAGFVVTW
jgi:hypothetical protein